jgi:lipopolysaccharide assembly LptE-like protein
MMETPAHRHHTPRKRRVLCAIAIAALLAQGGCGYSLAGRGSFLPAYIHRIGIPQFTNQTAVFDVERRVTDRVRSEFIGRGKYTILTETAGVDAVLTGAIASITITPAAFNDQQQATRYVLTLTAVVEFKDMKANKVLWSNPGMQYREEFDVSSGTGTLDPTAFFGQDVNALDRMASEFARSVVSAILEAF